MPSLYARPRRVRALTDCYFYHTMDIPGHGLVTGEWDLRGCERRYLGGVEFAGKRVLELGAASGFLTFYMESKGAQMVAYDLSENFSWDLVPFAGRNVAEADAGFRAHIRRLNNGFWLNHAAHQSKAKVVYGTIYGVPERIGEVDIATFCSILLHLRDPFLALQRSLRLVRETVIVTDVYPAADLPAVAQLAGAPGAEALPLIKTGPPRPVFMPQHWDHQNGETWWHLPPAVVQRFIGVLGFEKSEVTWHHAMAGSQRVLFYTVVGHRTRPS
jgi:hypothetical protein